MSELKSNSDRSRRKAGEKKQLSPVVNGQVIKKKKSEARKFVDMFVAEDKETMKSFIFEDVIIPAAKKIISDIVDAILYGESGGSNKSRRPGSRISYNSISDDRRERRNYASVRGPGYDYGNIIVPNKGSAEEVLDQLDAIIEQYGTASVADLYDLVGVTPEHTDYNYGWMNISTAKSIRLRDGQYTIQMPKAKPLT